MKTLLITPPFSALNTPYPATCYLKGYLTSKGYIVDQIDLGIKTINSLFSRKGLEEIFNVVTTGRVGQLKESYLKTIDSVMEFLKGKNPTLANRIVKGNLLPQSDRFDNYEESYFGEMDIQDHARYIATLYLNDIGDYIMHNIDPNFGFSRYSESLGISQSSFTPVENELQKPETLITRKILEECQKIDLNEYSLVGITIPFPGNLISALLISSFIKSNAPKCKIAIGGGWVNTELRSLTEIRLFNYVDYVILDDGELPLESIINNIINGTDNYINTYTKKNGSVQYIGNPENAKFLHRDLPAPDYSGLDLSDYLSLQDSLNPMHSLWNNGRWNKLTLAHGCYWKKCAFCDTTLNYISEYDPSDASRIVDKMESIIKQTKESGFHFVDEAAPPALLLELSLEILRRNLIVSWWTNIRFEKSFTPALAKLMAKSGCIGVSGGVEVASDRLLKFMKKGVSVEQVSKVTAALGQQGIMVHAYLMYGFPTQTSQECVDSLEIVRQFFKNNLIQSAYWHQFALTAHSDVGKNPEKYSVKITGPQFEGFARNDLEFINSTGDPSIFSDGLKTSLFNFMRGKGLDLPLSTWFNFSIPKTTVKKRFIESLLKNEQLELKDSTRLVWVGENIDIVEDTLYIFDNLYQEAVNITGNEAEFIKEVIDTASYKNRNKFTLSDMDKIGKKHKIDPDLWLSQDTASILMDYGLILL